MVVCVCVCVRVCAFLILSFVLLLCDKSLLTYTLVEHTVQTVLHYDAVSTEFVEWIEICKLSIIQMLCTTTTTIFWLSGFCLRQPR